jgi:hypothetical protein
MRSGLIRGEERDRRRRDDLDADRREIGATEQRVDQAALAALVLAGDEQRRLRLRRRAVARQQLRGGVGPALGLQQRHDLLHLRVDPWVVRRRGRRRAHGADCCQSSW